MARGPMAWRSPSSPAPQGNQAEGSSPRLFSPPASLLGRLAWASAWLGRRDHALLSAAAREFLRSPHNLGGVEFTCGLAWALATSEHHCWQRPFGEREGRGQGVRCGSSSDDGAGAAALGGEAQVLGGPRGSGRETQVLGGPRGSVKRRERDRERVDGSWLEGPHSPSSPSTSGRERRISEADSVIEIFW